MKIIAFNGSPRKNGNTETLLNAAIKGTGHDVTLYNLNDLNITPCQNCGGCDKTGICILEDNMSPIYEEIRTAHRVILASPVYFMSISAQAKAMIDRCQAFWAEKYLLNRQIEPGPEGRRGLLLLVGAIQKDTGIVCASKCGMAFFRTVSIEQHTTLTYTGVDAQGEITSHPSALDEARQAGSDLIK